MDFSEAVQNEIGHKPSVSIEVGGAEFDWYIDGRSIAQARDKGIDVFEVFSEIDKGAKKNKVVMSIGAMYQFLWMGLDGVDLKEVEKLPLHVMQNLPMEDMMRSIASKNDLGNKKKEMKQTD